MPLSFNTQDSLSKFPGLGNTYLLQPCPVLIAQVSLITFVSSLGVKKVYCNHLGRNGPAFPILTQTHRGEKEGRRGIK